MDMARYQLDGIGARELEEGILFVEMLMDQPSKAHHNMSRVFNAADRDRDVRVVVVGGSPDHYSEEGVKVVKAVTEDWETRMEVMQEASDIVYSAINCSKPIISLIPGPMMGVALVSDITIAAPDAVIVDTHTSYGVVAGDHAVIAWPLACGMAKSKYHLLTGEPLTGAEAERIGLVSLCVEEDQLLPKALEVARRLVAAPQRAVRWTKYSLNNWYRSAGPAFDASLAMEFITFGGPDVRAGVEAMTTGSAPRFEESY